MKHDDRPRLRPERVWIWALGAGLLALVGLAASIWRPTAPMLPAVSTELDAFAPEVLAAVDAYHAPRSIVMVVATVLPVLVPLVAVATPWGRRAVGAIAGGERLLARRAAVVALVLAVITSLVTLPLAAWARLVHDATWGFRTQTAVAWFRDWGLVSAGRWTLVAVAAAVLVVAVRRWPRSWPYRLTVAATVVVAVGVMIHPVLLLPVTLPMVPLTDPEQIEAIAPVLAEIGDPDLPVYLGEGSRRSTRVNALATGLGPTARVVLYDTLLELPPEQVASVVGHEIAHHQHRDLLRGVLLVASGGLPALLVVRRIITAGPVERLVRARGPGDPRLIAVALLVVMVLDLLTQPAAVLVSRRLEAAADARAVEITGDPATLIASTRVFTVRDLAEPEPPWWSTALFRTHPSVGARVRQAVAIAERDGRQLPARSVVERAERERRHPAIAAGAS